MSLAFIIKIFARRAVCAVCVICAFLCFETKARGAQSSSGALFPEEAPLVTVKPHGVPRKLREAKQIDIPAPESEDVKPSDEKSPDVESSDVKPIDVTSIDIASIDITPIETESSDKTPRETIDALLKELAAPDSSKTPKPSLPPATIQYALASRDVAPTPYSSVAPRDGKMSWPVTGKITSGYGRRGKRRMHTGIDMPMPANTPIGSAADGIVADTGSSKNAKYRGYGNTVVIDHGNGVSTLYAHCLKLAVKPGTRVKRGDVVAYVGRTGRATTTHVHFEVRKNGKPVNPLPYLTAR
ncbi:hypothetical protein AGMMS49957_15880 [Synergistales bacterium]|nr:hypothetical protein AGMMS49957_15880 [Synergistales bacterium]